MSEEYLNETGLAYFWSKIKAWCNSLFALDSNVVHKTGNESVGGQKTFTSEVFRASSEIDRNVPPIDSTQYLSFVFKDKHDYILGALQYMNRTSGAVDVKIACNNPATTTSVDVNDSRGLYVGYDENGIPFANAPSTSSLRSTGVDIVTRDWIPNDTRIVHTTGNESISGIKQFNDYIFSSFDIAKGTVPTGINLWRGIYFLDNTATFNDFGIAKRFGWMEQGIGDDGGSALSLCACKNASGSSEYAVMSVGVDSNGIHYGVSPSTSSSRSEGMDIVTRDWIPNDTRIVHTTGNENISGNKIFIGNNLYVKSTSIEKNVTPSTSQAIRINVIDKNNARLGLFEYISRNDGSSDVKISCLDPSSSSDSDFAALYVGYDVNGIAAATCPSTSSLRNYNVDIITRDWIPKDTRIVHRTGDESVSGRKAFQQDVYFVGSGWTKGSNPSSASWLSLLFADDGSASASYAGNVLGVIQTGITASGSVMMQLSTVKNQANSTDAITLQLIHELGGFMSFRPTTNGVCQLGSSGYRWKEMWCTQSSINSSSDERRKDGIAPVPDAVLDAWEDVDFRQFKFKDAVEEKGAGARIHSGLIAQRVERAFRKRGLDASRYGFFLYDEWDAEPEERGEDGTVVREAAPAGNSYGLRYVECLCIEAAFQRRENARLKKRVADLEDRLAALELRLGSE